MAGSRYSGKDSRVLLQFFGMMTLLIPALLSPSLSHGKIQDGIVCSYCHTMHNSQGGEGMTTDGTTEALLNASCAGCHSGLSANQAVTGVPFVFDPSGAPTYGTTGTSGHNTLAGGNFYWVVNVSHRKGHNVAGIATVDDIYGGAVPSENVPGTGTPLATQLTCAGSTGCHGKSAASDLESLRPASHHVTDDPTLGTSIPNSFRFLSGVKGREDSDWEFTVSQNDHNQYLGSTTYSTAATDTITSLCARCHGDFHGNPGVDSDGVSPWIRHPTDVDLPTSGEYDVYNTYKPETPVASTSLASVLDNVEAAGSRIVTCISCHRAHGSPFDGILRWDYKSWPASGYDGCGQCHTTKD